MLNSFRYQAISRQVSRTVEWGLELQVASTILALHAKEINGLQENHQQALFLSPHTSPHRSDCAKMWARQFLSPWEMPGLVGLILLGDKLLQRLWVVHRQNCRCCHP